MVKRSHFSNRFEPTYDIFNIISNYARHSTSLFKLRYIVRNKQANLLILLHVLFDLNCLYCCLFSHLKFLVYLNVIKFYLIFTICRSFIVFCLELHSNVYHHGWYYLNYSPPFIHIWTCGWVYIGSIVRTLSQCLMISLNNDIKRLRYEPMLKIFFHLWYSIGVIVYGRWYVCTLENQNERYA